MWAAMPDCLDGGVDVDLDLVGVTFLDSAGLNALVTVARRVGGAGGRLRVMSASKAAQRVLDISGVGLLLSVNPAPAGEPHSLRTEP